MEQQEAICTLPASIKSKTASCNTSEYTSKFSNSESTMPCKTALATEPIPDCRGANSFVNRPSSISLRKKSIKLSAITCVSSSGEIMVEGESSCSVKTIPRTFLTSKG